ncbi:MAG: PfkB family carbohydrate kinase [Clostridia bacterium]|nr:PfkB family carbohydrate kinase [Clostridia bacterium]
MVVIGSIFVDIKGYPQGTYIPGGRNKGDIQYIHGGVARNIVEDIANVELTPTFVSTVDNSGTGLDVIQKLQKHKVNCQYIRQCKDGMGTWLAVFNHSGDLEAAISKRPKMDEIYRIMVEHGDEIVSNCKSVLIEIDMDKEIVKRTFELCDKYHKPIYAVVSNMTIALERRDYLHKVDCFVCNQQEAGILFFDEFKKDSYEELALLLKEKIGLADIKSMVVTLGGDGAVYASKDGEYGYTPAIEVDVIDTTGAGDAFFSGVCIGLSYGKSLKEASEIGTRLAASVVTSVENVCPRFLPSEFGIQIKE